MKYESRQKAIQTEFFNEKCGGKFRDKTYPFVLKYRIDNLFEEIADDAIQYFNHYRIKWWPIDVLPTNHTLNSQVACVNHLFWLNKNPEAATLVLKQIDKQFTAIPFPETENLVEFELNGCDYLHKNYLGEQSTIRGAYNTCIDAAMLAKKGDKTILIFFEWKYTEDYKDNPETEKLKSSYKKQKNTYKSLLTDDLSPIILDKGKANSECDYDRSYEKFSVDPFRQLMCQTLLAWRLSQDNRYGTEDYIHVHVIPNGNHELIKGKPYYEITKGYGDICEGWANTLKNPEKYIHIDPDDLISKAAKKYNKAIYDYLSRRYWR